jgi:predicted  nucleic acid-binding Zn-ribbon protein
MLPDLERVIRLQQLETAADEARRTLADHPQRSQALDDRLAAARATLDGIKARLTDAQNKRRAEEKEVSGVQTRLAKYKDQLLEVKTNREYQAMLHEIETAQNDIKAREDRILETMMESDEMTAEVKKAEAELKSVEKSVAAERQVMEQEVAALQAKMDKTAAAREKLAAEIDRHTLAIFETTAKGRKGIAVSEARDGMCMICHVRLRPQVFNEVRRNDAIIQCDSCRRILYFVENAPASSAVPQA